MKICLLISGILNDSLAMNHPLFMIEGIDKFIHTWDIGFYKRRGLYRRTLQGQKSRRDLIDSHLSQFNVCAYQIENMENAIQNNMKFSLNDKLVSKKRNWNGNWCQIYGIYKVWKLMKEYENKNNIKYDYCIRIRIDLLHCDNFDFLNFVNELIINQNINSTYHKSDWIFAMNTENYEKWVNEIYKKINTPNAWRKYTLHRKFLVDSLMVFTYFKLIENAVKN